MHLTRRAAAAAAAMAMTIGLTVLGGAGSALAAPAGPLAARGCTPNYGYSFYKKKTYFVANPGMYATRPGGDKAKLKITEGTTVHGEVSPEGGGKLSSKALNKLLHDADLKVSANISYTKTQSVTQGDRWIVPRRWAFGWLAWGSYGYEMRWELARTDKGCKVQVLRRGTTKLPARDPGFDHGRGKKPPLVS
jgi:hypothetical protein